jgi:uncharacterized protein
MGEKGPQEAIDLSREGESAGERHRLPLHLFEIEGKHHAFDPHSGRFFRIDEIVREILSHPPGSVTDEVYESLEKRHGAEAVRAARDEVDHYIESGYIFPDIGEEDKPESLPVKPRIVSTTLNVVSACNLKCIYCWNKGGIYGREQKEKRMSGETARRAVDLMFENSLETDDLLVDFYGGEPLLNFPVLRSTMDYCKELQGRSKKRFSFKVTTNGTLLTEEVAWYFNKMGVSLGISIDGTKKIHDRNRPFPDGTGSWKRIQKNLDLVTKPGNIHVSARATLVPPDLDMVKAVKSLFRQGFYDTEVEFASESCEAFKPGGFPKYDDADIGNMKKEYVKFAKFYLKYAQHNDEAIDVGISNNITRVLHECHRFSPCGAGSNFITVSEDGDIYPCIGFVGMPEYRLGDVKSGIDLELLKEFRFRMRSVTHEATECRDCWARFICAGNCPANNEQHNRNLFKLYVRACNWLKYKLEVAMWVASEINSKTPSRLDGYRPV